MRRDRTRPVRQGTARIFLVLLHGPLLMGALLVPHPLPAQPDATLALSSGSAGPGSTIDISAFLDFPEIVPAPPPLQTPFITGYSIGVCNDSAVVAPIAIDLAGTNTSCGGAPPLFAQTSLDSSGWTLGVVMGPTGGCWIPPGIGTFEIARVTYRVAGGAPEGDTPLVICDTAGTPAPVETLIVVSALPNSFVPTLVDGEISVVLGEPFVRGDANDDGVVNIADALWLLNELFVSASPITDCALADDVNGDGIVNVADPITTLNYLFGGGPPPALPFPGCGVDGGGALLTCPESSSCP